ncbi:MAG: C10 family peptidase, partial [Muribaculaceae bacterium]|nr:C10 family peptidase [Muribaculaceae bacterium]
PIYYIVNYENEEGFVIVGANDAADPMVAISDECNLSMSDTTNNKSLAAFMSALINPSLPIDTITIPTPLPENVTVEPLLDPRVRKWGQESPFNVCIPFLSNGLRGYVGCGPLAVAMIMSYHQVPTYHEGKYYNWKSMISNYSDSSLAYLLYDIGTGNNLHVTYRLNSTGTNPIYFERTFKNYSYTFPSSAKKLTSFDFSSKLKVSAQLPMLVYGSGIIDNVQEGHAWVIDGLLHLQNPKSSSYGELSNDYYYHCVWGWYGKGNGYFKCNEINSIGGQRYASDGTDGIYPGYNDSDDVPTWDIDVSALWGICPGGAIIRPQL